MNLPNLVLGTMYYGTSIDDATSMHMLDIYVDRGYDLIDTANNYAFWITGSQGGESEELIGRWLQRGTKGNVRIATKIGARPTIAGGDLSDVEGLSAPAIAQAVDSSLQRLGMSEVDLLYAHIDDRDVPLEESLGALNDVVRAGKVRSLGLSNVVSSRLRDALDIVDRSDLAPIEVLQQRYSVLQPLPEADLTPHVLADASVREIIKRMGIPLVAYSPLLEGALADLDRPLPQAYACEANEQLRAQLAQEANRSGKSLPQMVLRSLIDQGVTPLLGARTPTQLEQALAALD